jgi:hypothetical protein
MNNVESGVKYVAMVTLAEHARGIPRAARHEDEILIRIEDTVPVVEIRSLAAWLRGLLHDRARDRCQVVYRWRAAAPQASMRGRLSGGTRTSKTKFASPKARSTVMLAPASITHLSAQT